MRARLHDTNTCFQSSSNYTRFDRSLTAWTGAKQFKIMLPRGPRTLKLVTYLLDTHQIRNHCDQSPENSFDKKSSIQKTQITTNMMRNTLLYIKSAMTATKTQKTLLKKRALFRKRRLRRKWSTNTILYNQIRNDCDQNLKTQDRHHTIYLYFLCFSFSFAFSDLLLSPSPST